MDFLLGSLTAGTGGDGMNLGSIENMEVNIVLLFVIIPLFYSVRALSMAMTLKYLMISDDPKITLLVYLSSLSILTFTTSQIYRVVNMEV